MDAQRFIDDGLIRAADLKKLLDAPGGDNIRILDATYVLPGSNATPHQGYMIQHLPGAHFFDIEEIADHDNPLPHMLPAPQQFQQEARALGISNDTLVVVYDQSGLYMASSRAWWMLRAFGHDRVCVLDGGLPSWQAAGYPVHQGVENAPAPGTFIASFRPALVADKDGVLAAVTNGDALILDARPAERFAGLMPEPRDGMRAGHIPGSRSVPFGSVIDPQTRALRDRDTLDMLFTAQGAQGAPRIITTCGSGVTACTVTLALFRAGKRDVAVYDGSWSEWGRTDSGTPIANLHS